MLVSVHFFGIWTSKKAQNHQFLTLLTLSFWLGNVLRATTACTFSTSERQIVVRTLQFFTLLTWKCASRHNGVHFFDIWTSKSGPNMVSFVHFDLDMCFAPPQRALFGHLIFQKWSEPVSFLHVWLGNVLSATTASTFSTSQLPRVVWEWCLFYTLTWKRASRHNGVQVFISHLASWLRTRRFSEPIFDPQEPQIIGKTQWIATFLPFRAPASSFFSLFLFPDLLTSFFLLSDSSHLCFPTVHIVGSLISKLPSIIINHPAIGDAPFQDTSMWRFHARSMTQHRFSSMSPCLACICDSFRAKSTEASRSFSSIWPSDQKLSHIGVEHLHSPKKSHGKNMESTCLLNTQTCLKPWLNPPVSDAENPHGILSPSSVLLCGLPAPAFRFQLEAKELQLLGIIGDSEPALRSNMEVSMENITTNGGV